jgi:DNA ligase (NAD+)
MKIPSVGPKIAGSIVAFFSQPENRDIIKRLTEAGVRVSKIETVKPDLPLTGKEFVITGTLASSSRPEAEAKVKTLGGTTKSNVTKNTTYLVMGADPGANKLAQAEKWNTPRLTEAEFLKLINETKMKENR